MIGSSIVITAFGDRDTGGGSFVLEGERVRRLDWLASMGLAVDSAGGRVARVVRDAGEPTEPGEILVSDARGVELYRRVDALMDAHDAVWFEDALVVASTSTNSLLWLSAGGEVLRAWEAPGRGDAWHLNSLVVHEGRLLACAFGRFDAHRAWASPGAARGRGIVFDVESGQDVIRGLTCPHTPFRLDDRWAVCDSGDSSLIVLEDDGTVVERVPLDGWTRGAAALGDHVYVGVSARRIERPGARAAVVVLDRSTLSELTRVTLPAREIYALSVMPEPLLEGLARGFRTNSARVQDADQLAMFRAAGMEPELLWAVSDPLPEAACRTKLRAQIPRQMREGETVEIPWTLTNQGGTVLPMAQPYPVRIGARWFAADGTLIASEERSELRRNLPPNSVIDGTLTLTVPYGAEVRSLRLAPVQELVRWFDDIDPANGIAGDVAVTSAKTLWKAS